MIRNFICFKSIQRGASLISFLGLVTLIVLLGVPGVTAIGKYAADATCETAGKAKISDIKYKFGKSPSGVFCCGYDRQVFNSSVFTCDLY